MSKQKVKYIQTPEDFLEAFGSKFNTENIVRFSLRDFSFEAEPRLIVGKDSDGKRVAKLRMNFKCRLNESGIYEVTDGKGEKVVIKNYPFSRSIEFPVSIEQFTNERALQDWAQEIVEGLKNTLPHLLVEAAKAHFLIIGSVVSEAHEISPDFEKGNDLFYTVEQAARHFEQTEKKICRIEKSRKNAPFKNRDEYIDLLNQAGEKLSKKGLKISKENIAEELKCNGKTLYKWNEIFNLNWIKWKKTMVEKRKSAMI